MFSQSHHGGFQIANSGVSRAGRIALGLSKICLLSFLAPLMLVSPLAADILVTREGAEVETRGAWRVEGRQVVFKLPNGTLSALRLSEVDLEASRAATLAGDEAQRSAAEATAPKERESVLTITNESLGQSSENAASGDEEDTAQDSAGGLATAGAVALQGDVVVVDWSYDSFGEDPVYMVTGVIENRAQYVAEQVSVHLDIVAVDEETGARSPDRHILRRARVRLSSLPPGASTEFSYPVTQRDLSVHGESGFTNPVVSFDVQFNRGELPLADGDDEDDPEVPLALVDADDASAASTEAADSDSVDDDGLSSDSDDDSDDGDLDAFEDADSFDDELEDDGLDENEPAEFDDAGDGPGAP